MERRERYKLWDAIRMEELYTGIIRSLVQYHGAGWTEGEGFQDVVRPVILYRLETVSMKKSDERRVDVAEIKMLRWMFGINRKGIVRNKHMTGAVKVAEASRKVQEDWLELYGHVKRRPVTASKNIQKLYGTQLQGQ